MFRITPAAPKILRRIARYVLCAVFLLSSTAKLASSAQLREFVSQFITLPQATMVAMAYAVAGLELSVALLILFEGSSRLGGGISFGMLLWFTLVLMLSMQLDLPGDCGCFGEIVGKSSVEHSILRNIALLCISLFIVYRPSYATEVRNG